MRRALSALAAAAVVVSGGVVGAATGADAADTTTHLPLTSYADMLVDEAHGHVFFTPGANGSAVVVTDLTGANPTTLSGMSGATGIVMSADGTAVFVADYSGSAVTKIDTATLAVTTLAAGPDLDCVRYLALAGGRLWYSHGCATGSATIGTIDPSTGTTSPSALTGGQTWYDPPYLAAGAPTSSVIAAADLDTSPVPVRTYDVSSGSGVLLASSPSAACQTFYAMAVSPSGADVALACDPPYHIGLFRTDTFAPENSYGGDHPYPSGAALSADGGYVAGGFSQNNPNVEVFPVAQPTAPTATYRLDAGGQGLLVHDGLRFGPSGDLYAVIPTSVYADDFDLVVLHGSTLSPATITMSAPATAARTHTVTVAGQLSSGMSPIAGGQTIQLTRHDLSGTFALPSATTNADGTFSFSDTPTVGGPVTYTATWAGDASHRAAAGAATLQVSRVATTVSVSTKVTRYGYHARVYISAHLGSTYNSRRLAIYATPYRGARQLIRSATVNSHGSLFASYVVSRRTTFTAAFPGDYRVGPASAARTVLVHGHIAQQLQDWYATSHGYRLYHQRMNPTLAAQLFPLQWGVCLYFRAQRFYGGGWHTTATSPCFRTNTAGEAAAILIRNHIRGEPYRLRAEWHGNPISLAAVGSWAYLKFTR